MQPKLQVNQRKTERSSVFAAFKKPRAAPSQVANNSHQPNPIRDQPSESPATSRCSSPSRKTKDSVKAPGLTRKKPKPDAPFQFSTSGDRELDKVLSEYGRDFFAISLCKTEKQEQVFLKAIDFDKLETMISSVINRKGQKRSAKLDIEEIMTQFARALKDHRRKIFMGNFSRFLPGSSFTKVVLPNDLDPKLEAAFKESDNDRPCMRSFADAFDKVTEAVQHIIPEENL